MICNIFALMGPINKILYLKATKSACLVEYASQDDADKAISEIDNLILFNQKIKAFYSNNH